MVYQRKAAIEMSLGTIVVLVLSMTLLILGMYFIRNMMCGAIGLTSDINDRVKSEIRTLFQSSQGEVVCIGAVGDPIPVTPGRQNIIACGVKAATEGQYTFKITEIYASSSKIETVKKWIRNPDTPLKYKVSPGDEMPKPAIYLSPPDNAPEEDISITMEIYKDEVLISTQPLNFRTSRLGFFKAAMC